MVKLPSGMASALSEIQPSLCLHRENPELVTRNSPVAAMARCEMHTSGDGSVGRTVVVRSSHAVLVGNTPAATLA